jgi:hypothetical protein
VPITVANACCFEAALQSTDPKVQATGQLVLIAFYYLLRVREYTKPRMVTRNNSRVSAMHTKQFQYNNVGLFNKNEVILRKMPLSSLLHCDSATLKISNQKNGQMGETIHQKSTGSNLCPIKALAHCVDHINAHNGKDD